MCHLLLMEPNTAMLVAILMKKKGENMAEYLMNEPNSVQSRDNLTLLHVQSARGSLSVTQA